MIYTIHPPAFLYRIPNYNQGGICWQSDGRVMVSKVSKGVYLLMVVFWFCMVYNGLQTHQNRRRGIKAREPV